MADANPDFDQIASSTISHYMKTFADNVFNAQPLTDFITKTARDYSGGKSFVVPLMTAGNNTWKSYAGYDPFDKTPQEGFSAAEYKFKNLGGTVIIDGESESLNDGPEAMFNLLQAKITQSELSGSEELNTQLYADGTGNSGKDIGGLGLVMDDGASLGGINPATAGNGFWKPVVLDATADSDATMDTQEWRHALNAANNGADQCDFGITTPGLWEAYEAQLIKQERFTGTQTSVDERFVNLLFAGTKLHYDAVCPTGTTYFLNSRHLWLAKKKGEWFKSGKFIEIHDVDAKIMKIIARGNVVTDNRGRNAVITGQTLPA